MMDAYYWQGELFKSTNQFDSAINYYNLFIKEIQMMQSFC